MIKKKSTKRLLKILIVMLVLVVGLKTYRVFKCEIPNRLRAERYLKSVQEFQVMLDERGGIKKEYMSCNVDSDCVLVQTSQCSHMVREVINKTYQERYEELVPNCADYRGLGLPVVDWTDHAVCRGGRCMAVGK